MQSEDTLTAFLPECAPELLGGCLIKQERDEEIRSTSSLDISRSGSSQETPFRSHRDHSGSGPDRVSADRMGS